MGRPYDEVPHNAVVSNLLDLQARLRGDPASMVVPKLGRPPVPDPVARARNVVVEDRIEALRRRLQFLELEIDAYESAVSGMPGTPAGPLADGDVIDLQHAVDRRLTHD